MGVLIGTMSLGQAMPNLEFISTARGAAAAVWEIIDLVNNYVFGWYLRVLLKNDKDESL